MFSRENLSNVITIIILKQEPWEHQVSALTFNKLFWNILPNDVLLEWNLGFLTFVNEYQIKMTTLFAFFLMTFFSSYLYHTKTWGVLHICCGVVYCCKNLFTKHKTFSVAHIFVSLLVTIQWLLLSCYWVGPPVCPKSHL